MDSDQIEELMELISALTPERIEHLLTAVDGIYTILYLALILGAGGFVVYLIFKPLKILVNGGLW